MKSKYKIDLGWWEKEYLTNYLKFHEWNIPKTAKALGISQRNLYHKMKKYKIKKGK